MSDEYIKAISNVRPPCCTEEQMSGWARMFVIAFKGTDLPDCQRAIDEFCGDCELSSAFRERARSNGTCIRGCHGG